jgi:hypothetical protein
MSREAAIAEIDAELEKLGTETEPKEEEIEEVEEEEEGEPIPDKTEEEPKKEETVEEKPPVKLEIKTDLPDSTLGYKLREQARKNEELERKLAELTTPKVSKEDNYEGYIEAELGMTKKELAELKTWKDQEESRKQSEAEREGAFRELRGYEAEAKEAFEDFDPASNYVKSMLAASIKLLEPSLTQEELAQKTLYKYAEQAAIALNAKKHPGQAVYEMAHQLGYKKAEDRPKIEVKQDNKIPLAKLAENKKKSAGMGGTGGNGTAFPNMDAVSSMTNAERMKLTESDWARLEAEG